MADLGVTKTHSRPHTSNDNPFSESAFKTLKYQPEFPKTFGCKEDASTFCRACFRWYNQEHHHSALGLMTPNQIHYGHADAITTARQAVLDAAFAVHPERFVSKPPVAPEKPGAVWINPPPKAKKQATDKSSSSNHPILVTPQRSSPDSTGGNRSGPPRARPITLARGGPEGEVPVVPRGRPIAIGHRPQHPNEPAGPVPLPPRDGLVKA